MIIKEEGFEPFADQASSDSGQYRDDLGQDDNNDDQDYQVDLTNTSLIFSVSNSVSVSVCVCVNSCNNSVLNCPMC